MKNVVWHGHVANLEFIVDVEGVQTPCSSQLMVTTKGFPLYQNAIAMMFAMKPPSIFDYSNHTKTEFCSGCGHSHGRPGITRSQ
jgi:hypothetical protein